MNELTTRILKILVMVFAVVLASTIFYHLLFQDYETETAIYYEISDASAFQGVYIRNETVEHYSGTGAVRYCVDDGAKLGVGSVIAEVYAGGDQIDLRRRIAEKEEELAVLRKIENPGTSETAQPANLASLISEQYKSMIRFRERGDFSAMADSRQNMTVLMSTYEKVTNPSVDYHDRIAALEDEIDRLNVQKSAPEYIITAPKSAYFASYVDGYEERLNTDSIRSLTADQLAEITDGTAEQPLRNDVIGKLIDGYAWYIAGVFDNTKMRLSEGDRVTVRLESLARPLNVRVETLRATADLNKTQAVFRCEQLTRDVVQHRSERVELLRDTVKGIRIPRSAIRFKRMDTEPAETQAPAETAAAVTSVTSETAATAATTVPEIAAPSTEDVMGVYVLVGESAEFRRLDVIYEDENYLLSSLDAGSGYVSLYDDIIVKGVMADGE